MKFLLDENLDNEVPAAVLSLLGRAVPNQASVLTGKYPYFAKLIREAEGCVLVRVTPSDVRERTLDELLEEFR